MLRLRLCPPWTLFAAFILILAWIVTGCGSSRHLRSVTVSPVSADAQNFAGGKVQFTATGTFSKPPSPVPITQSATWCVGMNTGRCAGNINPGATVSPSGVAQCEPLFAGTVTILAGEGTPMMMNPDTGTQLQVFGSAQLTCP